jgi:glutamate carboxypeptidase
MAAATAAESKVLEWLAAQRGAMLALLETLVNTDSGSYDKAGVDKVGGHIRGFLDAHAIAHATIRNDTFGDAIRATVGAGSNASVLLMGHRDTVWPKDEATRRPFRIENGRAYGPGVSDMKSGLVMNAFVLAALKKFGVSAPVVGLFTADEEIGSPSSRALIESEARRARAVFNAEPGRPTGNVVSGRKGSVFMRCSVVGKAAHSGSNFAKGISAIDELARKIIALHALTDLKAGTTVNVGLISGGQTVNTVAPWAKCEIDLRFVTPADRAAAMEKIRSTIATCYVPGTAATLEIYGEFLPLVESAEGKRLFDLYVACASELDVKVEGEFTGGCADSGFAAQMGAPTLCGIGPVGGGGHTPEEYSEVDTLPSRAQILALAVMRVAA